MSPSNLTIEGRLSKFTNVIKGYQFRYFVVDPYTATLNYYISENLKSQKPKGSILLRDSVILASEDDPTMFTIHRFENKVHLVFYLKAQSSREREKWIKVLKMNSLPNLDPFVDKSSSKIVETNEANANNCFICLEVISESTATMCGHLFCRNCIHKWIETKPVCPVCNSRISKDKLIRLYGINENASSSNSSKTDDKKNLQLIASQSFSDTESQVNLTQPRANHNRRIFSSENLVQMFNQIIYKIFIYMGLFAFFLSIMLAVVFYFSTILGTSCFIFSVWCIGLIMKRN